VNRFTIDIDAYYNSELSRNRIGACDMNDRNVKVARKSGGREGAVGKGLVVVLALVVAVGAPTVIAATSQRPAIPASVGGETPELGRLGAMNVGTSVLQYTLPNRVKITIMGAVTGHLPTPDRRLSVRFWYPASPATSPSPVSYRHEVVAKGKPTFVVTTQGIAIENGAPLAGGKYPLVLMSHGYAGWASHFSNLAENLASKGYVVAAIDHDDASFDSLTSFQMSFGNVMLDRSQDQRQILGQILQQASTAMPGATSLIDGNKVGLIGYSMGGFGALSTAGAPYDAASKTIKQLPADAQRTLTNNQNDVAPMIKALVLLAPWGGQPDNRSWTSNDLAKVKAPVLLIAGNQDDVVNFDHGVSWIFDNLTGARRNLLVYHDARHNIAGNPVPLTADTDFSTLEFFTEPVWRTERMNQINQHFITAFLDLNLKGDVSKAGFLAIPTPIAANGKWPSAPGEQWGGKFADDQQSDYWRGFQRRWAMGLEMHAAPIGSSPKIEPETRP
jgi:predicted dienelactone hydrolase